MSSRSTSAARPPNARSSTAATCASTPTTGSSRSRLSAGYPIQVPVVDLVEIGNGGGSIAWVDDFGKLHVGPGSAGAVPGPAAYGRGGTEATTTDANLALGRVNANYFCGGELQADMEAVQRALDGVASRLGVGIEQAARGVIRIANNNMINALKLVSVNRGYDPRDFDPRGLRGGAGAACTRSISLPSSGSARW